jgi:hypothetical protein
MSVSAELLQRHLSNMAFRHGTRLSIEAGILFEDARSIAPAQKIEPVIIRVGAMPDLSQRARWRGWQLVARYLDASGELAIASKLGTVKPPVGWFGE